MKEAGASSKVPASAVMGMLSIASPHARRSPGPPGGRGGGEVPREDQLTPAWKGGTGLPSSMVACLHGVGLQYPSSNTFLALRFLGQSYESHVWVRVGLWEVLKSVVCFCAVPQIQILFCCAVPQEGLTVTSSSLDLGGLEEGLIPSSLFSLLCSHLLGLLYTLEKCPFSYYGSALPSPTQSLSSSETWQSVPEEAILWLVADAF